MTEADLGRVVAVCSGTWSARRSRFLATDSFFFVRVDHDGVDTSGHEALERSVITGFRWWTVPELESTRDLVLPLGLADLTRRLLTAGPPAEPLALPWR